MHKSLTVKKLTRIVNSGEYAGFCTACGTKHTGVEPDARKYECKKCHKPKVYGAEELLMMVF